MKYINYFSISPFPYYIYKLNTGDSIFCLSSDDINRSFWIINGLIYFSKICTNRNSIVLALLSKNHILDINKSKNTYYKITAVITTYIITFKNTVLYKKNIINKNLLIAIIRSYKQTLQKYEQMNYILAHKYTKYRIIQLMLFLCLDFGFFYPNYIKIPFIISNYELATILGSNQNTINHALLSLIPQYIVRNSKTQTTYIYINQLLASIKV